MDADDWIVVLAVGLVGFGLGVALLSIGWALIFTGCGWLALVGIVRLGEWLVTKPLARWRLGRMK